MGQEGWFRVGHDLWNEYAPGQRFLLVEPARDDMCGRRDLKYVEYAGRLRGILARLKGMGGGVGGEASPVEM